MEWNPLFEMENVNDMEKFWTRQINDCLDKVAPQKIRKGKKKKTILPQEVQNELQNRDKLKKKRDAMTNAGVIDSTFEQEFKTYNKYI